MVPAQIILVLGLFPASGSAALGNETCWTSGPAQFARGVDYCVSSVLEPQGGITYGPQNIADGKKSTAWCEGVPSNGEGQLIEMRIKEGSAFRRILIQNGYGKSEESFRNNGRLKTIEVSADGGEKRQANLPDTHDVSIVELPRVGVYRSVTISILEVYSGEKSADTCVDYISPDFEHEEALSPLPQAPPPAEVQKGPSSEGPPAEAPSSDGPPVEGPPAEGLAPKINDDPFGDLDLPDAKDLEINPR
jgi:hypothetical protein